MMVYEVRRPTKDEARRIAQRMYQALLSEHSWPFASELSADALDALSSVPPREMKKRLLDALGQARMNRRDHIEPQDIGKMATREQRGIGFTF
jgi:ATP-dependent Lon protease